MRHMDDLEPFFGSELLSYLLATDGGPLPTPPREGQREVINFLRQLLQQFQGQDSFQMTYSLRDVLLAYVDGQGTTQANVLRAQAGGGFPRRHQADDPVADELLRLGQDVYSGYLFPQVNQQYGMILASP